MLEKKALYNLAELNYLEDPSRSFEPWQIEDLRVLPLQELLERLQKSGIDKEKFLRSAEECPSPEKLFEVLGVEGDALFLVIFELWRRLCPEKRSLSIFCDELDFRIFQYDKGQMETDQPLQDSLAALEEILDENADSGEDPHFVFEQLTKYCAHDLEGFLYDYILDQIEHGNSLYGYELLEGFYPYMHKIKWFDLLRIHLAMDPFVADEITKGLLKEDGDLDFQLELLRVMGERASRGDFLFLIKKTLPLLKVEMDLQDLLESIANYFRRIDEDGVEKAVLKLLKEREIKNLKEKIPEEELSSIALFFNKFEEA